MCVWVGGEDFENDFCMEEGGETDNFIVIIFGDTNIYIYSTPAYLILSVMN